MTNEEQLLKSFYEAMDLFKVVIEFSHDRDNIQECEYHLVNYQYQTAYSFVQKLLAEYENEMNSVSDYNGGKKVYINQTPVAWSDEKVKNLLLHFQDYIPAYALKRECKAELAKMVLFGLAKGFK